MKKYIKLFVLTTYPVLLLLLAATTLYLYAMKADNKRYVNQLCTVTNALYVVRAVEEYHSKTGNIPESLDSLTPQYIPQIYPAPWGDSGWIYEKQNGNFTLAVGYKKSDSNDFLYPEILYSSENKSWKFNN